MRLTKKTNIAYALDDCDNFACIDKLGQLENIEDELGIDLITLFKALKNGIWMKDIDSNELINVYCYLGLDGKKELKLFVSPHGLYHHLEDYGKTWALTKEELL